MDKQRLVGHTCAIDKMGLTSLRHPVSCRATTAEECPVWLRIKYGQVRFPSGDGDKTGSYIVAHNRHTDNVVLWPVDTKPEVIGQHLRWEFESILRQFVEELEPYDVTPFVASITSQFVERRTLRELHRVDL